MIAYADEATVPDEDFWSRLPLQISVLDAQQTRRAQQPRGLGDDHSNHIQPISTGEQCNQRIMITRLGDHRFESLQGDVGRVGNHQVDRAIQLIPTRWAYHFNRARALGVLESWPEAVSGYRSAQQLYPDDYAIAFNLGQALQRTGDDAAAVEEFKRAATLDATEPSFQMAIGMAYERLKKPVEAAAAYTEALRLAPDAPDADRVRTRIAQLTRGAS